MKILNIKIDNMKDIILLVEKEVSIKPNSHFFVKRMSNFKIYAMCIKDWDFYNNCML